MSDYRNQITTEPDIDDLSDDNLDSGVLGSLV
jgi:hypothetical protein